MHKLPFVHSQFQSTQPLELVHSDVWGPAPISSSNGYKYYLLFVDDFSRYSWLFCLNINLMYFLLSNTSKPLLKNSILHKSSSLELIVVENTPPMPLQIFVPLIASHINFHALTPLNKMVLLKGNIDTSLNVL
jgi:hypothetical protein